MTCLLYYFIAFEIYSNFVKDHVRGNTTSDRDFDDHNDDIQGDLGTGSLTGIILKVILTILIALTAYYDLLMIMRAPPSPDRVQGI